MKKLNSAILAVFMSFYGVFAMTPALAIAKDHGNGNQNENHGSVVSAVARSHSEDGDDNHGSVVSAVAKDNHGHREDKNNNGHGENGDDHEEDDDGDDNGGTPPATTTPAISNLTASSTGTTSESIIWDTNKLADSKVYYSTTTPVVVGASSTSFVSSAALVTHHTINLSGLVSGTTYRFIVVSSDSLGNTATSSESQFTTGTVPPADTTAPNILFAINIGSSASTTSLIWVTNEASNSNVWISTTTPVATTTAPIATSGTLSFFHQLSIPDLATSTLYYYTIGSTDSSGNTGFYSNSFTTPSTL